MIKKLNLKKIFQERLKKNGQFHLTKIQNKIFLFVELPAVISPILMPVISGLEPVYDYELPQRENYVWCFVSAYTIGEDTYTVETTCLHTLKHKIENINLSIENICGKKFKILYEVITRSAWSHHAKQFYGESENIQRKHTKHFRSGLSIPKVSLVLL